MSSPNGKEANIRQLKPSGHVGFDSLPDQLVNRSIRNGFVFNIMCIGETGMGKSTLMDTLFNTYFKSTPSSHTVSNVKIKAQTYELQESNVRLKLTICETIGYGDQINKDDSFRSVGDYINEQFEKYLQEELKIKRSLAEFHDSRVHVCLYFICPTGHGLKSLDLVCLKQLDSKVNIIPIIAKADTVSKSEMKTFKEKIVDELKRNDVKIYQFPTEDETMADVNEAMNDLIPFAVVGSIDFVKIANKQERARQYPWGIVQVENENHCDFVHLREMLIRTNMQDMIKQTDINHYELFRQRRLLEMGFGDLDKENKLNSFKATYEMRRCNHLSSLLAKEEEVRQVFVERVKVKETDLKESERNLNLLFDKSRRELFDEKRKLDESRRKLEEEYLEFTTLKNQYMASQKSTLPLGRSRRK